MPSALSDFPCRGRGAGKRPFFPGIRRKEASASRDLQTVITKIAWNLRQWWPFFVTETYKLELSRHQLHNGERFVHVLLRSLSRFPTETHTEKKPENTRSIPGGTKLTDSFARSVNNGIRGSFLLIFWLLMHSFSLLKKVILRVLRRGIGVAGAKQAKTRLSAPNNICCVD